MLKDASVTQKILEMGQKWLHEIVFKPSIAYATPNISPFMVEGDCAQINSKAVTYSRVRDVPLTKNLIRNEKPKFVHLNLWLMVKNAFQ